MREWNDTFNISKKLPTDEELIIIEKELSGIDLNEGFEVDVKNVMTEEEFKQKEKLLTKKELKIIDEMVRVIEDPSYISKARKRRMKDQEEHDEGISFDNCFIGNTTSFGEDFDPQY